jgi:squalene synthase HpnC
MQLLDRFGPEPQVAAPAVSLDEALAYVRGLASTHYENFSVLSSLVPRELRDDFAAVYAYCRWSDDLADETGADDAARARSEALLAWWRGELERCFADPAGYSEQPGAHPVFTALAQTVRRHGLPAAPFHHLLDALVQDQRVTRYQTWDELLGYCRGSANPVGRIVLHLGGYPDTPENAERYAMSDAICTALQLTNFWQDVRRDLLERDRVYMPTFETGLAAETLRHWAEHGRDDPDARVGFIRALRPLVERTWELFDRGRPLPRTLGPTLRPIVWLFAAGGRSVLRSVERVGCATLWERPTLGTARKGLLIAQAWGLRGLGGAVSSGARG